MNRFGVTIEFDYETEADIERIEADLLRIVSTWQNAKAIEVHIAELESQ